MSRKLFAIIALLTLGLLGFGLFSGNDNKKLVEVKEPESLNEMLGKPAPDFNLKDQKGQTFKLSAMRGKKVILFFNEGIMCYPACWNQMAALGTDPQLNTGDVVSASIVAENSGAWGKAFEKMPELNMGTILFDFSKSVSTQYGMLSLDSSMHKGMTPGHTYLIIDQKGLVRYTLDDPKMAIQNQTLISELSKI